MIVICEECGKKYRIDPSKIKGKAASFKCRVCTHVIMVTKPELESSPTEPSVVPSPPTESESDEIRTAYPAPETETQRQAVDPVLARPPRKRGMFGLRSKMLLLFLFINP